MAQLIERFLTENSSLIAGNIASKQAVAVSRRNERRPDKVYGATALMKWHMILNGIDSPYMLDRGKVTALLDEPMINSELAELKEFGL